jgi:2-dehydro-3-deoxygalactonokinase
MGHFLSCDWGTSSFRLRLVAQDTFQILAEYTAEQGIASTFSRWQESQGEASARASFYLTYVQQGVDYLEKQQSLTLRGIPIIFSGMASSSIGIKELVYGTVPFDADGQDIAAAHLPATAFFSHPICLISGIRSEDDVMRGEETQLVGVLSLLGDMYIDGVFLFPGTHSKHIWVKHNQVVQFKTYMTGEFFDLLSNKSILSASVQKHQNAIQWTSFNKGVEVARSSNLLHAGFMIRTQHLFGKLTKEENHDFLSGLLIGTELKELLQQPATQIYLCCNSALQPRYESAMSQLGIKPVRVFSGKEMDQAVIRGQMIIYKQTNIR